MNKVNRGLGRGLDALLATSAQAQSKQQSPASDANATLANNEALREIAITDLEPGEYQPRKDMSEEALAELADSIRAQGVIQPIVVRPVGQGRFEIIAGERRWRASKLAGLAKVPCLVKEVHDRAAVAIALIENIQREDLNAIEEAQALERLQNEFSLTHQQVAEALGKSRTAVSNLLRLNQLDETVKQYVIQKQLDMGHARALLALPEDLQPDTAQQVVAKGLTVRDTEKLVRKLQQPPKPAAVKAVDQEVEQWQDNLSDKLGTQVAISRQKNGRGKIVINFDESEKFKQILAILNAN
ncbi:ParB/RepB/Spo0J family partition protein [Thaumasiovibrio subtropicus]|uniref:ParB/RepB/Spo0J family partition protein n=1 Tax=Thaumasiovibrio subtropicus TaxID=1891207 RepID=UPI000B355DE2|nr:ParB/RepB/Spo0J family partition protein [Thaumasiovibrio subtropicus]